MSERTDALVIPADEFTNKLAIKKLILFFDSLTFLHPMDKALVNNKEVTESLGSCTFQWAERNRFPRSESYSDEMQDLLSELSSLQSRGIIRMTSPKPHPAIDGGVNYSIWHSAIADSALVTAAAPDRFSSKKPPSGPATYLSGASISIGGIKSKYEISETKPAVFLEDADEDWSYYAHLRLGRALKSLRIGYAMGLTPLALDRANQQILNASAGFNSVLNRNRSGEPTGSLAQPQFDLDMFESHDLMQNLNDMSWKEVQQLRKHTLPGMNSLRVHLKRAIRLRGMAPEVGSDVYNSELAKLFSEFNNAKEKLANDWIKLRVGAITKFGGAVGGTAIADSTGLIGTIIGAPWIDLLAKILAGGLIGAVAVNKELQELIPSRQAVKQHPLYFTDRLGI